MKKILLLAIHFFALQFASAQTSANFSNDEPIDNEVVEVRPEFHGGFGALVEFINKNYILSDYDGYSGVVLISFIVERNGSLSSIKIVKDLGQGTGEEAERVMSKCPLWIPGQQDGKPVRVIYQLPITIKI